MINLDEILNSINSELIRLEEPRNRSRYFVYGKVYENDSASSYSVIFSNVPDRVIRSIKYDSAPLFKLGDVFVEGRFEGNDKGIKIIFDKNIIESKGLKTSDLSKITDYGVEYIMDGRNLIADLLNFSSSKKDTDNKIALTLLEKSDTLKFYENLTIQNTVELNESQKSAISKSSTQNVTFIWGPPGTGKTKTMGALAAKLIKNGKRVLLTALSNKALDQLLISMLEASAPLNKCNVTVSRVGSFETIDDKCKIFSRDAFQNSKYKIKRHAYKWTEHVCQCSCVAANFASIFSPKTANAGYVDYIIADEMSMVNIPSIIAASYFAKIGIVLGGDPMQLPPIFPEDADIPNEWFSKNIFEMAGIKSHDDPRVAFLDTQYRMQQPIGDIVSKIFYDGELKTGTERKELKGEFKSNIIFVNKIGKIETVNGNIISENEERRYNSGHSAVIAEYARKLLKDYKPSDIGVIAPYNAQVVKIKEDLKKMAAAANIYEDEINKIQVSTIHSFQGQEKSVIIMNICDENVRPTRLTAKKELINVAISRAKELLIIVGNKDYLLKSEYFSNKEVQVFKDIIDCAEVINFKI